MTSTGGRGDRRFGYGPFGLANPSPSWQDGGSMESDGGASGVGELNAPANPLIAAAAATSLYGSGVYFFSFLLFLNVV